MITVEERVLSISLCMSPLIYLSFWGQVISEKSETYPLNVECFRDLEDYKCSLFTLPWNDFCMFPAQQCIGAVHQFRRVNPAIALVLPYFIVLHQLKKFTVSALVALWRVVFLEATTN